MHVLAGTAVTKRMITMDYRVRSIVYITSYSIQGANHVLPVVEAFVTIKCNPNVVHCGELPGRINCYLRRSSPETKIRLKTTTVVELGLFEDSLVDIQGQSTRKGLVPSWILNHYSIACARWCFSLGLLFVFVSPSWHPPPAQALANNNHQVSLGLS